MRPRQEITEIFSTFLVFDADRLQGWVTDPRLRRSVEHSVSQLSHSERSEAFLELYWYKAWQTRASHLALSHLAADLQEACYWAAQKATRCFESVEYSFSDCFQVAIASLEKVLQGFDPKRNISLKGFANLKFRSVIIDTLRQRWITDICTPWALLHKLSKKRLIESLQNAGLASDKVQQYVMAWTCFNTLYAPTETLGRTRTTRKMVKPEQETWEAIATLYNQYRNTQLPTTTPAVSSSDLEKWLTACATAARQYLYPSSASINAAKRGQEEGELLDDLPDNVETALAAMIAEEEATQANQINAVLLDAIKQLEPSLQQLLQLYYVQGLNQQQIAKQLHVQQYTISRQLTKIKKSLQQYLIQWSRETLHISPNLDVLESISTILEEWLKVHYDQK